MKAVRIGIIIVILVGAIGYAWFRFAPREETVSYTGPLQSIRIANIGEYSVFNIIARDKGFFRENGLDAVVDEYDSGATSIAALISGDADVAIAADFVGVTNMFKDDRIRILAALSEQDTFHLIARKDHGIAFASDLRGKRIGVTRKTVGEYYLGRFLASNKLQLGEVDIVDLRPLDMIEGITKGTLDAVVIFDPHAYSLEQSLGSNSISWSAQGGLNTFALAYTTDGFATAHPETLVRYMRSLASAEAFTRTNPEEARSLVSAGLGYDGVYTLRMWDKFKFTISLSQGLILSLEDEARWLMDNGLVERGPMPNYLDRIRFETMDLVKPAAVSITH